MHLNIQGGFLTKKLDLEIILQDYNIAVVCLNKHWLKYDNVNILNSIPNYNLASFYLRLEGHGGSCILLKNDLKYIVRDDLCAFSENSVFEISCVEILSLNIIVVSIYRTPNVANFKNFLHKLESVLNILIKTQNVENVYIASDFNVDILEECSNPQQKFEFLSMIEQYGFKVNFSLPTRLTKNTQSCIDNILTLKLKSHFSTPLMNLELGLSDHRAIFIDVSNKTTTNSVNNNQKSKKRIFSSKNVESFVNAVKGCLWDVSVHNGFKTNSSNFFQQFFYLFDEAFPLKFYSNKLFNERKKSWVTLGIKVSSARKRELSRLVKFSNDELFVKYVKEYRSIFKKVCNASKQFTNSNFIKDSDDKSKAAWSVVKSELGCKKGNISFSDIKVKDQNLSGAGDIANYFNTKFTNISNEIGLSPSVDKALKLTDNIWVNQQFPHFSFQQIDKDNVLKVIKSLKNKNLLDGMKCLLI